jgi:hypothetical protein
MPAHEALKWSETVFEADQILRVMMIKTARRNDVRALGGRGRMSRWDKVRRIEYEAPGLPVPYQPPPPALPPVAWGVREMPAYRPGGLETDAAVPAAQAALVGACWGLVAVVTGGIVVALARWPWYVPPVLGACVWSVIMAWHVTKGVKLRQELLWAREEIERKDIDGDGQIGKPRATVRVELERQVESGYRTQFLDIDAEPHKVRTLARAVLNGRSLSEAEWTGAGQPFSRSQFRSLRGGLMERGLVRWANEKAKAQGCELTPAGRAVFEKLANLSPIEDG